MTSDETKTLVAELRALGMTVHDFTEDDFDMFMTYPENTQLHSES